MPRSSAIVVDNSFVGGLKTEHTGLNFPENACIETFNLVFNKTGLVERRLGIDFEVNFALNTLDRDGKAVSNFYWRNASGDGTISFLVIQIGPDLVFYRSSDATITTPLSHQAAPFTIDLTDFVSSSGSFDETVECQFAEGNGYLFVFHKDIDPIYVTPDLPLVGNEIILRTRDLSGLNETGIADDYRPLNLTTDHKYNLGNQGWGKFWSATSVSAVTIGLGSKSFTTQSGLPIEEGDRVRISDAGQSKVTTNFMIGAVTSYVGTTLTVNVTHIGGSGTISNWLILPEPALMRIWQDAIGNFPSNADSWWKYKRPDPSNPGFDPGTMISVVTENDARAPKGHYILDLFNQDRNAVSGLGGIANVETIARPTTGAWFAGRIWYSGINAEGHIERLYFSQIIERPDQFGKCFQINDPSSEEFFDILPSDGGFIVIQGAGVIYKLFPIVNGMLVFAEKGIWFITGSQGIGFTATDYTVTKVSEVATLSATSFVSVLGMPLFWNEEGIYAVSFAEQGSLSISSLTDDSIATFYEAIPLHSKKLARGFYNPITYEIQWLYRNIAAETTTERWTFTDILNFDTKTKAFYPWTIESPASGEISVNGVVALGGSGGDDEPLFTFKYITSRRDNSSSPFEFTFSEQRDENYVDWAAMGGSVTYESYLITGSRVYGEGIKSFQVDYLTLHALGGQQTQCDLQARWDWSSTGNTGKWSSIQRLVFGGTDYEYKSKRMKLRGSGKSVQYKISSVDNNPMALIGWTAMISANRQP